MHQVIRERHVKTIGIISIPIIHRNVSYTVTEHRKTSSRTGTVAGKGDRSSVIGMHRCTGIC
jgi:hypothetical protein